VCDIFQSELKYRFRRCTDPGDPGHEPLFLVAALLDPRYKLLLNPVQMETAKNELLKELREAVGKSNSGSSDDGASPQQSSEEPRPKCFCHLSKLLEKKIKEGIEKVTKAPARLQQLDQYIQAVHQLPEDFDPLQFWIDNESLYPFLASVAVDVLTIPGSSAPIERVFSTAGLCTGENATDLQTKTLSVKFFFARTKIICFRKITYHKTT